MSEYLIQSETLTSLGDQIRTLGETTGGKTPAQMTTLVSGANTTVSSQATLISQIQSALEGKALQTTSTITLYDSTDTAYWQYYDLVNNTDAYYERMSPRTINGHIGDLIIGSSYYLSEYEYSGAVYLGHCFNSYIAFKITSTTATIAVTCFVAGTQITMADGSYKNIEDVVVGDKILGYDGSNYVTVEVLRTFVHHYSGKIYKVSYKEGTFEATPNHPIYVNGEYHRVDELKVGDKLLCNNKKSSITSIETCDVEDIMVYNLDSSDTDNYIANFCLAHNKPT